MTFDSHLLGLLEPFFALFIGRTVGLLHYRFSTAPAERTMEGEDSARRWPGIVMFIFGLLVAASMLDQPTKSIPVSEFLVANLFLPTVIILGSGAYNLVTKYGPKLFDAYFAATDTVSNFIAACCSLFFTGIKSLASALLTAISKRCDFAMACIVKTFNSWRKPQN